MQAYLHRVASIIANRNSPEMIATHDIGCQTDIHCRRHYASESLDYEPSAIYNIYDHPLVAQLLRVNHPSGLEHSHEFMRFALSAKTYFKHGAIFVLSDAGAVLYQQRREGRQTGGGGNTAMHAVGASLHAHTELHHEMNVVSSAEAVLAVSCPVWIQDRVNRSWCWVQAILVKHESIHTESDASLCLGGRPIWSRELAHQHWAEDAWAPRPSWQTVKRTQHYRGHPVFGLTSLHEFATKEEEKRKWRACDRDSLVAIWELQQEGTLFQHTVKVYASQGAAVDADNGASELLTLAAQWDAATNGICSQAWLLPARAAWIDKHKKFLE